MVAGAITGGLEGGLNGAIQGAIFGGIGGLGAGLIAPFGAAALAAYGAAMAVGGAVATVATGGSLSDYSAQLAGSIVGGAAGAGIGAGIRQGLGNVRSTLQANQVRANAVAKVSASLKTDNKPVISPSKSRLAPIYDVEGKVTGYRVVYEKSAHGTEVINRKWGGEAFPEGHSWSPENAALPEYDNAMGLPGNKNTGEFISRGTIKPGRVYYETPAAAYGQNKGGGTEYIIVDPANDIRLDAVTMPDR